MKHSQDLKLTQNKKVIILVDQDEVIDQIPFIKSITEDLSKFYKVDLIWVGISGCSMNCHPIETSTEKPIEDYPLKNYRDLGHNNYIELFDSQLLNTGKERFILISFGKILISQRIINSNQEKFSGYICFLMSSKSNERSIFEVQKLNFDQDVRDNHIKINSLILQSGLDEFSIRELFQGRHNNYHTFSSTYFESQVFTQDLLRIIDIINNEFSR